MHKLPDIQAIREAASRIAPHILRTPTVPYYGSQLLHLLPSGTELMLKLELLQKTGSFKPRGALNVMMNLSDEQKIRGVTAFSAGNHAIATAYAASILGLSAKVAMPKTANAFRVDRCRGYGAEIVFADDIASLIEIVDALEREEGRTLVHPFEGVHTTEGTGAVGLELCEDAGELDVVVVPVGGGGLISGVATAVKQLYPACKVYGVEPDGATGMKDSLSLGRPLDRVELNTIADSLGAPMHKPYSFDVIRQTVDDMVTVSDQALVDTMKLMFGDLKLAVEPAGAAALAAILGPLKSRIENQRVGVVICGTNIDPDTYVSLIKTH